LWRSPVLRKENMIVFVVVVVVVVLVA